MLTQAVEECATDKRSKLLAKKIKSTLRKCLIWSSILRQILINLTGLRINGSEESSTLTECVEDMCCYGTFQSFIVDLCFVSLPRNQLMLLLFAEAVLIDLFFSA